MTRRRRRSWSSCARARTTSDDSEEYYSYFEDQVIRDVVNDLCDKTGYDYDIVYKMVMTGGYQIYSTYEPEGAGGGGPRSMRI